MDIAEILTTFGIPLSLTGIIGLFINALVVTVAIMLADKIIAHNIEAKKALIMALVSYFVTPLILTGLALANIVLGQFVAVYFIPLLVWIALSQVLLKADFKQKLSVAVIAYVIYMIMTFIGLPAILYSMLPI